MQDELPDDLIEQLVERKYPGARYALDAIVAIRREGMRVPRQSLERYDEIQAYRAELARRPVAELLDLYQQAASARVGMQLPPEHVIATVTESVSAILTQRARNAANVGHKEDRAMRDQAISHFKAHRSEYANKDKAAEAIAGKVVPAKFGTVRRWLRNI